MLSLRRTYQNVLLCLFEDESGIDSHGRVRLSMDLMSRYFMYPAGHETSKASFKITHVDMMYSP